MILKKIKIYWSLALKHPLYFFNAYLAAVLTNYLLTLQPGFLKVFINQGTNGATRDHLLVITFFMMGSLALAFIFDTIEVSTSTLFKVTIEKKLRTLHYKYSKRRDMSDISFPIQRGIFGLTEFTLLTSLDLLISITNLIIVLAFIFNSNQLIGSVAGVLIFTLLFMIFPKIKKLGNISKEKEKIKIDCIENFHQFSEEEYEKNLIKMQKNEASRFSIETLLVFSNFFIFKLTPALILFSFIFEKNSDYGELASLFLYFGLLYQPYKNTTKIIKRATLFFTQAEIFKDDIERAILIDKKIKFLPKGLICIYNKNVKSNDHKKINALKESSKKERATFQSSNIDEISKSDFVLTKDLELITTAAYLWGHKNEAV